MSKAEKNIHIVFRRLTDALELLSEEELRRLSDPQYSIEIKTLRRRIKEETTSFLADIPVEEVIAEITILSSRREAQMLLDAKFSSRKILEIIARKLDIPIVKQDKVEELRDKIVEATVGARIRSQAIQGTNG